MISIVIEEDEEKPEHEKVMITFQPVVFQLEGFFAHSK